MTSGASPELERLGQGLGAYARASLDRAVRYALRLHAEELTSEHLLAALLEDESCAATALVLHAFADPATVGGEVLALCPGILVVGSGHSLPFSTGAVSALHAARAAASGKNASVTPTDLFHAALDQLPPDQSAHLFRGKAPERRDVPSGAGFPAGPLFREFEKDSLRALGVACRVAAQLERTVIGPVHLLCGALDVDRDLAHAVDLTAARVRLLLAGRDEDPTPLPERRISADARLAALIRGLPPGADTLEILGEILRSGSEELRALLQRQKVTPALVERSRGAFCDPEPPRADFLPR
jgi:hypothetical protein